ncbi:coenzyme F420 hydrogenase subunit gamma [Methanococcus maripaludis]|uniref:Coenzyme F420 hydrogenase subunit gamma n=1 Tax=Methanococcus maripaludis TaxID=39152 RepID=A0A7J9PRG6_METMI|nr:coenzyme F420 hydrogenase subunit gamma [Methanococcus maripaludis]MBA2853873.1 coenzyme F420 hydrogenase subunit gamma [Methanococcus maripaludis]MBA2860121.1 coenzyme F420 hydrogenase subunit gamma [Methanococcus maripaludis]MBA2868763.1 coenzyme F420 hydrogenase subunit gamma [Methanococcus maripaludis]MBB6402548.1 coenzyme F420 hydrogenase subunit gamma [Methanococcus maripaludis]
MVRVAHIHMSGCTGCLISLADTYEKLLDILGAVDLVYALTLADEKTEITETDDKILIERKIPEDIDIALVEGSVCLDDHHSVEDILTTRKNSKIVVALGACAASGGVTRFARGGQMSQPAHSAFVPIGDVIKVDLALPGCPPSTESIVNLIMAALNGDMDYLEPFAEIAKYGKDACGCDVIKNVIDQSLCMGCGTCAAACQVKAIDMIEGKPNIMTEFCIKCGICGAQCPRVRFPELVQKIE